MTYSEIHKTPYHDEPLSLCTEYQPRATSYVLYRGKKYYSTDFNDLLKNADELKNTPDLISRVVHHLFLKTNYDFIQDAQRFLNKPMSDNLLFSEFKDKNKVAQRISPPIVSGFTVNFFVSQIGTGVPYRVQFNIQSGKISIDDL